MEEREKIVEEGESLSDFMRRLKRRRRLALGVAAGIFFVGSLLVFIWPNTYESSAVILLEEPEVPAALVPTTVTVFAAQQVQYINQRVMTRSNLASIIEKFDLYPEKRQHLPTMLLADDIQDDITLDVINVELTDPQRNVPTIQTIAFTVGFRHEDPATARKVANELVSLYLEENLKARTVQTAETRQFLGGEVGRLDVQVRELEKQVADFKEKNKGALPELNALNLQIITRTEDELLNIQRQIQSLEETKIKLKAQLAEIDPVAPSLLADGRAVVAPENQLKALQTQLAMLEGRYDSSHPDVIRTRREIKALREQTGLTADFTDTAGALSTARSDLAKAKETYSPDHPEVVRLERLVSSLQQSTRDARETADAVMKPDNPAYIQISAQYEAVIAQEAAYRRQEAELRARLRDHEERLRDTPRVEQELVALQRQLESATARYLAMREREFGAMMGESLESEAKGERFVLVEPPDLPLEPATPNRVLLLSLLLVLSPALAMAAVMVREATDQSIWGANGLLAAQGAPPIAEIPQIMTRAEMARQQQQRKIALIATPAGIVLLAVIIHLAVKPLDVLWYTLLRELGI